MAQGLCSTHYQRFRIHGDPTRGDDKPKRGSGFVTTHGYRHIMVNGKEVREHRHLMEQHLGRPLLPSETVHHINGVRSDNRLENLELWSKAQPYGQRVMDKVAWAIEMLDTYAPDALSNRPFQLRL